MLSTSSPLLWFRNDLRTNDNPALQHFVNLKKVDFKKANLQGIESLTKNATESPIGEIGKAIFFISEKQWFEHDWAPIKIDLIKRHAAALIHELALINIDLSIITVPDFSSQVEFLKSYCNEHAITQVIANSELEYNEQQRDKACLANNIPLTLFEADVIVPKGKIRNQSGKMYKVFTPFKRAWLAYVSQNGVNYLGHALSTHVLSTNVTHQPPALTSEKKESHQSSSNHSASIDSPSSKWPLVSEISENRLPLFFEHKISDYESVRDIPSIKGTSGFSPYLAAGLLSPRYIFNALLNRFPDILIASDSEVFCWLNEIIWREFYRHLMFDQQRLCQHQCFNPKYHQTFWPYDKPLFTAWCEGKTGYPIVDAAMRQLNQTGWMHNRLRMVVASFLTKHLLIDWRLGEKYFMQHLIDGDLAANNGGWQWASSTGCDAQPYFRIFNPIRQSERFDPNGTFIRKYIPELSDVPDKQIHFPHKFIKQHNLSLYWPAIVDHKEARVNALAFYQ